MKELYSFFVWSSSSFWKLVISPPYQGTGGGEIRKKEEAELGIHLKESKPSEEKKKNIQT